SPAMAELAAVRRRRLRLPGLLQENPPFRRFFTGQAISLLGDQVTLIALPLAAVLAVGADAAPMGYLTAAAPVPNLLFSLPFGAWVDRRWWHREAMIAADVGRAVLVAAIPIAYALDMLSLNLLYVVAFLTGSLSVLFFVSYNNLFVALVPRERYLDAN